MKRAISWDEFEDILRREYQHSIIREGKSEWLTLVAAFDIGYELGYARGLREHRQYIKDETKKSKGSNRTSKAVRK